MNYGYTRVTTDGQSVEAQIAALTVAGAEKIFREVASGTKTDRPQLRRMLDQFDAGDVLTVTRLDRLARSARDLLNTLATIAGKQAGFRSLGDSWADTTTPHGRQMLTVLGGLAEFERELIRARTGEGRARAKARGVKLGRKPKLTVHQKREAIRRRDELGEPVREIARTFTARFRGSNSPMSAREIFPEGRAACIKTGHRGDAINRTLTAAILIAFVVALTSPAYACITAPPGMEPINSARLWKSWDSFGRFLYLRGFQDGASSIVFRLAQPSVDVKTLQATAMRYELSQIGDVMTSIYSDPANAYIALSAMVYIARDKLDGKNAEELLINARQNDCEYRSTSK